MSIEIPEPEFSGATQLHRGASAGMIGWASCDLENEK
jgi:hypothetical protein